MAIAAHGADGWSEVFADFQARTGLFPTGVYDVPSENKPLLAGGMHWTGEEYLEFLRRLFLGELLANDTRAAMFTDQTPTGEVEMVRSPAFDGVGETWHYGLGCWRECPGEAWEPSCDPLDRVSSPGAYGAYPFIDFAGGYYGLLARQGDLGTFRDGLAVYRDLAPLASELATAR
jgi:CubicO group peptidase (beta-lactamase class C family)